MRVLVTLVSITSALVSVVGYSVLRVRFRRLQLGMEILCFSYERPKQTIR